MTRALAYALSRGFQVHPGALRVLEDVSSDDLQRVVRDLVREKSRQREYMISRDDLESFLGLKADPGLAADYRVLSDPTGRVTSAEGMAGFNALFASRFEKMRRVMAGRPEARAARPISSVVSSKPRPGDDDAYVFGLVAERDPDRNVTRLELDDPSGSIKLAVFGDLRKTADALLNDQLVLARVSAAGGGFVARDLILPDVSGGGGGRSEADVYAAFLSDLHVGSRFFMEKEFREFVSWLSSPDPVARRVRFVVICGDLVDGVGIYPNQDRELEPGCQTVEGQLRKADGLLAGVPPHVTVFVLPGNHDPGRRALPQPAIPRKYFPGLWERGNVVMLGNPAAVSLNGVRVCAFHGQSIDDIVKTTPGLSYEDPIGVMRHLLRARHLSPIFGSRTPLAPEAEDMMVVDEAPDIFHVGHVHVCGLGSYRGVLMVNSGAWQSQTPFQVSVGQTPTPGIAVLVNLRSLEPFYWPAPPGPAGPARLGAPRGPGA